MTRGDAADRPGATRPILGGSVPATMLLEPPADEAQSRPAVTSVPRLSPPTGGARARERYRASARGSEAASAGASADGAQASGTAGASAGPSPRAADASRGSADPFPDPSADERTSPGAGRYAPSPSGDLHLGNLRTAILAWVMARSTGRRFVMRVEDLDRVRPGAEARQLEDLEAIGLDWDGPVIRQSTRREAYEHALAALDAAGMVYECYCTRREILEAPSAPHAPPGAYPGTCRFLTEEQREAGRARMRDLHRMPALRLAADVPAWRIDDEFFGEIAGPVDDVVLRRGDGVYAYNLASVVDDGASGIDQVVRADDLLTSAPRQAHLGTLLGLPTPRYAHVPLAVSPSGDRLAKRDGAVTLRDRLELGESAGDVVQRIGDSLGLDDCRTAADVLEQWDPEAMPRTPWVVDLPAA